VSPHPAAVFQEVKDAPRCLFAHQHQWDFCVVTEGIQSCRLLGLLGRSTGKPPALVEMIIPHVQSNRAVLEPFEWCSHSEAVESCLGLVVVHLVGSGVLSTSNQLETQ
jgi:hypothetical protein